MFLLTCHSWYLSIDMSVLIYIIFDISHLTYNRWHITHAWTWYVTIEMSSLKCNYWHVTIDISLFISHSWQVPLDKSLLICNYWPLTWRQWHMTTMTHEIMTWHDDTWHDDGDTKHDVNDTWQVHEVETCEEWLVCISNLTWCHPR